MIKAEERYLLQQAGFTERQINTQMQKFYNLFRVAPMPQMQKNWIGLTDEERMAAISDSFNFGLDNGNVSDNSVLEYARTIEAKLKEKNNG